MTIYMYMQWSNCIPGLQDAIMRSSKIPIIFNGTFINYIAKHYITKHYIAKENF